MKWFRKRSVDRRLLGTWETDPTDAAALERDGKVRIEFKSDGSLIYSINAGDRWQQIHLVYRIERTQLITDQPSARREERTDYEVTDEGRLVLNYGGVQSRYIRKTD